MISSSANDFANLNDNVVTILKMRINLGQLQFAESRPLGPSKNFLHHSINQRGCALAKASPQRVDSNKDESLTNTSTSFQLSPQAKKIFKEVCAVDCRILSLKNHVLSI